MSRCVVNVSTGPYLRGQKRLIESARLFGVGATHAMWPNILEVWPKHEDKPYAFKAYALELCANHYDTLLWADASILPIRSMELLWERIEREGYWIARNGWNNYQWTADSAYPDLFADVYSGHPASISESGLQRLRDVNKNIPHVVATAFGLSMKHKIGRDFLAEYFRLASETRAFCGPWVNAAHTPGRGYECGPDDVLGHRHDQTAASVIAWRLGMKLTDCPEVFAYSKRRADGTLHLEDQDERTILLADGRMDSGVYGG